MQDQIIHYLNQAEGYLSGEDISREFNLSRTAIWKSIEELRRGGYDIVAVPHLGYKLVSSPDKLYAREIQNNLNTKTFGKKYLHFDTIDSTMDHAFQLGVQGEEEGTVVCAEGQSKGRGRMARTWTSPKGKGIYFSLILRPHLYPSDAAKMTLYVAVALCEAINQKLSLNADIKWPNDILINGKKVAGILTELSAEMDRVRFIVIGIGVNVNTSLRYVPETATALKSEVNQIVSRKELFQDILCSLEKWYDVLNRDGFDPIIQRWRELSSTLGREVSIGDINGKAVDLDENGGLIVENKKGERIRCMAGDVVQV